MKVDFFTLAHIMSHPWPVYTSLCLVVVGFSALWAIIAQTFRDTVAERICLAGISLGALSRAIFVWQAESSVPSDFVWLVTFMAVYCVVIWHKHRFIIPRRPDYVSPEDAPRY